MSLTTPTQLPISIQQVAGEATKYTFSAGPVVVGELEQGELHDRAVWFYKLTTGDIFDSAQTLEEAVACLTLDYQNSVTS